MKKIRILSFIFLSIMAFSCALPRYTHVYESPKGLDLSTGKWLVNSVGEDLSFVDKQHYEETIVHEFRKMGLDSIDLVGNVWFDYITPDKFQSKLSEETLQLLQKTTDYNFIVNVQATIIKDEVTSLMLSLPDIPSTSKSELVIEVYDIDRGHKIYHQRILGTVSVSKQVEDIKFAKSASGLLNGALKRGLKEIATHAVMDK